MEKEQNPDCIMNQLPGFEVAIYGRVAERLLVVLSAFALTFFAFRLFQRSRIVNQSASASGKLPEGLEWRIDFTKVGPGAFFALYGFVILGAATWSPLQITDAFP